MTEDKTVFLAGATGAIGSRLLPLLARAGYRVHGTTRSPAKAAAIEAAGATAVLIDVYDREKLMTALAAIRPAIVIHQLTDLPPGLDPARMENAAAANARIRIEGTRNLVDAATHAGTRLFLAQSIAFAYAPGREPHVEDDALDTASRGTRLTTVQGVAALEQAVLGAPAFDGIVLRYGNLYGPGTGSDARKGAAPLHVDDAATATMLAVQHARPGIFNIAEPNPYVSSAKAERELGWHPDMGCVTDRG